VSVFAPSERGAVPVANCWFLTITKYNRHWAHLAEEENFRISSRTMLGGCSLPPVFTILVLSPNVADRQRQLPHVISRDMTILRSYCKENTLINAQQANNMQNKNFSSTVLWELVHYCPLRFNITKI
jgi:hypothetical protein